MEADALELRAVRAHDERGLRVPRGIVHSLGRARGPVDAPARQIAPQETFRHLAAGEGVADETEAPGAFLDELTSVEPRLSKPASRLRRDHSDILGELTRAEKQIDASNAKRAADPVWAQSFNITDNSDSFDWQGFLTGDGAVLSDDDRPGGISQVA